MQCTFRGVVLLHKPGERKRLQAREDAAVSAKAAALAWLARAGCRDGEKTTAADVCAAACLAVYPEGTTGGAYIALMELLGWHCEPDVIHILKAAGPTYRNQLPAPKVGEKDVPGVPTRAT